MLRNIQKYLLLNYPLLWNIHIVPILSGAIFINICFYVIGYLNTNIDFRAVSGYNNMISSNALFYFGAVVSALFYFIYWILLYSKNNAFKVFYPKTAGSLYLEWIFAFVIIFSMSLFPYSLRCGEISKLRSYVDKEAVIRAAKTLNMIDILIPEKKTHYYKEYPDSEYLDKFGENSITVPDIYTDTLPYSDTYQMPLDRAVEKAEQQNISYPDYPDFVQLSLLNYSGYGSFYIPDRYDVVVPDFTDVIQWLKTERKDKVEELMDLFLELQRKHGLTTNLTKDKWLELVYNPKKYPVRDFNLISRHNYNLNNYDNYYGYNSNSNKHYEYYLSYRELATAYEKILGAHMGSGIYEAVFYFLHTISFALFVSLLVFSYRSTSGKSWLIAFVILGLLLIVNLFFTMTTAFFVGGNLSFPVFYLSVLLIIFIYELIIIVRKLKTHNNKGRSNILINHLIWFIPAIPVIVYALIYTASDCFYYEDKHCLCEFLDNQIFALLCANIILTFISMWFFIRYILLKWKGLPEE